MSYPVPVTGRVLPTTIKKAYVLSKQFCNIPWSHGCDKFDCNLPIVLIFDVHKRISV